MVGRGLRTQPLEADPVSAARHRGPVEALILMCWQELAPAGSAERRVETVPGMAGFDAYCAKPLNVKAFKTTTEEALAR